MIALCPPAFSGRDVFMGDGNLYKDLIISFNAHLAHQDGAIHAHASGPLFSGPSSGSGALCTQLDKTNSIGVPAKSVSYLPLEFAAETLAS